MKIYVMSSFLAYFMKGVTSCLFILPSEMIKQSFLTSIFTSFSLIYLKLCTDEFIKDAIERS